MATYTRDSLFSLLNDTPEETTRKSSITAMFSDDELLTPDGGEFPMRNITTKLKQMVSEESYNFFYKEDKNAVFQVIHAIGWMDNEAQQNAFKKRWQLVFSPRHENPISLFNFSNDKDKMKLLIRFSEILDSSANTRSGLVEIDKCIMELFRQIPRNLYNFDDTRIPFHYGLTEASNFIKSITNIAHVKSAKSNLDKSSIKSQICHKLLLNEAINHVSQIIQNYSVGYNDIDFEFHPYEDVYELFCTNNHIDDDKLLNSALKAYKKRLTDDDINTLKHLADLIFAIHYYDRGSKTVARDAYSHDPHMRYIIYCFIICCKKNKLKLIINNSGFGSRPMNIYKKLVKIFKNSKGINPYDYIDKNYYNIDQQLVKYILNIISWLCRLYETPSLREGCSFIMYMNTRKMTWETILFIYNSLLEVPFETAMNIINSIKVESNRYFTASTVRKNRMVKRLQ
ncbi:hypothetical protein ABN085_18640 [Morganella morganii]|uniref:hypothetical protein n=1 Tax=Morganella morganii TaxID=582 RepID=UPI0032DB267E